MLPTPDELILALLSAQPRHGYQLLEVFHDPARLAHIWNMSTAQIYAVLKRLERDGDIYGVAVESASAPTRTEFHVTPQGAARMRAWLDHPAPSASIRRVRIDFLSRVYAARALDVPVEALAARQYAACLTARERLADEHGAAESDVARMALSLQIAQMDAVLGWMQQTFSGIIDGITS